MAPKKASTGAPKKSTPATHPSYKDMIKDAIVNLKDRSGSSRQAIKKYIHANNNLGNTTDAAFNNHISAALANGVKSGDFEMPKGASGPTKLAKKSASKPAAKGDKKPAAKKAATKKTGAAKPKSTTAKPKTTTKANVGKKAAPKKPAAAPAIQTKEPVVLGKTKSGRVTKSSAPTPALPKKATAKKPATKKAAPKKSATPKKADTKAETS